MSPIPLDISEKQFLDDLITYIGRKPNNLDGTEEIIEIIDDKTISTAGCIFVKQ